MFRAKKVKVNICLVLFRFFLCHKDVYIERFIVVCENYF